MRCGNSGKRMSILAINTGSSSLKFGVFSEDTCEQLVDGEIDWANGDREHAQLTLRSGRNRAERACVSVQDDFTAAETAIEAALRSLSASGSEPIAVVGHRIVHGGAEFRNSALITEKVKTTLAGLSRLAPLHNPPALDAIAASEALLPEARQVAVFDTAFFTELPPKAYLYALPYEYCARWGIRRFGFHGLSHAYCTTRAAEMLGKAVDDLRLITCHLGGGCSAAAVKGGKPVATTLGFSPLEGLMMGTRSGSVDPGILIYLQREQGLTVEQIDHDLNHASGLLGVSGVSPSLAKIESAMAQGNERARLAFDMFADRVRGAMGSLAASLGGVDAVVFTDRIGEHSPALRAAACQGLEFMGLKLDPERNANGQPDADVAAEISPVRILVVHTEEELVVAREARRVVHQGS